MPIGIDPASPETPFQVTTEVRELNARPLMSSFTRVSNTGNALSHQRGQYFEMQVLLQEGRHLQFEAYSVVQQREPHAASLSISPPHGARKTKLGILIGLIGVSAVVGGFWYRLTRPRNKMLMTPMANDSSSTFPSVNPDTNSLISTDFPPVTQPSTIRPAIEVMQGSVETVTGSEFILYTQGLFGDSALAVLSDWNGDFYASRTLLRLTNSALHTELTNGATAEAMIATLQDKLNQGGGEVIWVWGLSIADENQLSWTISQPNSVGALPILDLMQTDNVAVQRLSTSSIAISPDGSYTLNEIQNK